MQQAGIMPNGTYSRTPYGAGERPAFVEFETRAFEDRAASQADGVLRYKDRDIVVVRTPGSTNQEYENDAGEWLASRRDARDPFYPAYQQHYEAWKSGQEIATTGTPLEKWPGISPAQIMTCKQCHIRSVEDLAEVNEDGLRRIGMGSRVLKDRARAWLESAPQGQAAEELASLRVQVESLIADMAEKDRTIGTQQQLLDQMMNTQSPLATVAPPAPPEEVIPAFLTEDGPRKTGKAK